MAAYGGAVIATAGSSSWGGTIILSGPTTFGADGIQSLPNGVSAAQLTITNTISDAAGSGTNNTVTKVGYGNVVFAGANTYGGQTVVQQGALIIDNPLALSGINTVVTTGAALELESSVSNQQPITLNGDGIPVNGHNSGALVSIANNNTYNGTITLNSNSTIGVDSGSTLTIGGGTGTITNSTGNKYTLVKELTGTLGLRRRQHLWRRHQPAPTPWRTTPTPAMCLAAARWFLSGALVVQNSGALGVAGNTTTVLDGAQLVLEDVQQVLTLTNPTTSPATQFKLSFNGATTTTSDHLHRRRPRPTPWRFRTLWTTLSTIGGPAVGGSVTVTPNAADTQFTITFGGNLAGVPLPLIGVTVTSTAATGTVAIGSFNVPATQNLRLSGTGIVNSGALESVAGDNTWERFHYSRPGSRLRPHHHPGQQRGSD